MFSANSHPAFIFLEKKKKNLQNSDTDFTVPHEKIIIILVQIKCVEFYGKHLLKLRHIQLSNLQASSCHCSASVSATIAGLTFSRFTNWLH